MATDLYPQVRAHIIICDISNSTPKQTVDWAMDGIYTIGSTRPYLHYHNYLAKNLNL